MLKYVELRSGISVHLRPQPPFFFLPFIVIMRGGQSTFYEWAFHKKLHTYLWVFSFLAKCERAKKDMVTSLKRICGRMNIQQEYPFNCINVTISLNDRSLNWIISLDVRRNCILKYRSHEFIIHLYNVDRKMCKLWTYLHNMLVNGIPCEWTHFVCSISNHSIWKGKTCDFLKGIRVYVCVLCSWKVWTKTFSASVCDASVEWI